LPASEGGLAGEDYKHKFTPDGQKEISMKKLSATVHVKVLGSAKIDNAEPGQPQFVVAFEAVNQKPIPGSSETFEERTVERFKSFVLIDPGERTLKVEIGCYTNGNQPALYGRVISEIGVSTPKKDKEVASVRS